jgi:TolA-binding protein
MKPLTIAVIIAAVISLAMAVYEPAVEPNQSVPSASQTDYKAVIRQLNRKIDSLEKQLQRLQVQVRDNENSINDLSRQLKLYKNQYSANTTTTTAAVHYPRRRSVRYTITDSNQR